MATKDQTSDETPEKETSEETATEEGEQIDYKSKFVESQKEAIRLRKENDELKKSKETQEVPEDEKKVRETLSKIEKEKLEQEKQDELQLRKELDDLHTIYGEFDDDKLLKIVERYGVYNEKDEVKWDAAMELYEKVGEVPASEPKGKLPTQKRGQVNPQEVETPPDVSKKSLPDLVKEGLKKFGL